MRRMRPTELFFVSCPGRPFYTGPNQHAKSHIHKTTPHFKKVILCCNTRPRQRDEVPLLEMRNISYQVPMNFDLQLFKNMNFKVYSKELVLIIGENGAGKSTGMSVPSLIASSEYPEAL